MPQDDDLKPLHPLDVLRSGRWSRALFGTYVLSVGFFEAAPLRSLRRAGATDIRILADVAGVAGALGEAGAREVGRTYAVEPVRVPDGCFHPKFLLLDGEAGPRMVVGSGNLTCGGWGSNLELAEVMSPATHATAFADMAGFLYALAATPRAVSDAAATLRAWAIALRQSGAPGPGAGVRLLHNVDRTIADQLVEAAAARGGARRMLVASPYFGAARAVRRLADALGVGRVDVHVSGDVAVAGQCFDFDAEPTFGRVVVDLLQAEGGNRPLHAKLIEIECADAVLTLSGSVNASGPALSTTGNVELAVMRVSDAPLTVTPFKGDLPVFAAPELKGGSEQQAVLTATLKGDRLAGIVLGEEAAGSWSARLDAVGLFTELGQVEVHGDGSFATVIAIGDLVGYGTRRAVLTLTRGSGRAMGFVTFPDLMELNRRFGSGAGSMLRVVGGSEEDEDLAGVLEYLARHPDESTAAWRGSTERPDGDVPSDDRSVSLADLEIRPRAVDDGDITERFSGSVIERLLRAWRGLMRKCGTGGGWTSAAEEDDARGGSGTAPPRGPSRSEGILEIMREIAEVKAPDDPTAELLKIGEVGVFILARRPDAERLAEFAAWWCGLANAHLRGAAADGELMRMATTFTLIDALPARAAARARRRLAQIVGPVGHALDSLIVAEPLRLDALVDAAGPGMAALGQFAEAVREEVSPYEELPLLVAAVRRGAEPPVLPRLDGEPETARVRSLIATGRAERVRLAEPGATSCPGCYIGLAGAEIERLRNVGMVFARNCCARVVLVDLEGE